MPKLILREDHWRFRAEEARTIADQLRDAECKRIMGGIATSYDQLAELCKNYGKAERDTPTP